MTFKRKVKTYRTSPVRALLDTDNNMCVPIAIARAQAINPDDDHEVAVLAKKAADKLIRRGTLSKAGWFRGDIEQALKACGVDFVRVIKPPVPEIPIGSGRFGRVSRKELYPTVAQFLRDNPDVDDALYMTTGHAGYTRDGVSYSLGARKRVMSVVVIRENSKECKMSDVVVDEVTQEESESTHPGVMVRKHRLAQGLPLKSLAYDVDRTAGWVSDLEHGRIKRLKPELAAILDEALGLEGELVACAAGE